MKTLKIQETATKRTSRMAKFILLRQKIPETTVCVLSGMHYLGSQNLGEALTPRLWQ